MTKDSDSTAPMIDLGKGYPTRSHLPVDIVRDAIANMTPERAADMLAYGPRGGPPDTVRSLAAFLSKRYRFPVSVDELILGSAISLNLSMVCQLFSRPGDIVVCEDPTYFHAVNIFGTSQLKMHGIPTDEHGMCVDLLARELDRGLRPRLVYCIPAFHNPTGVDLASERAEKLLQLAKTYDFLIIADEPYTLLHFKPTPPRCMMSYDRGRGRVIGLGSFTKILAPGLRAGWVHAHPDLIERFSRHGALLSGGSLSPISYEIVEYTLSNGYLAANIDRLREIYRTRADFMSNALRSHIGHGVLHEPRGGYFVWLQLQRDRDCTRLLERARERGVLFTPGSRCAVAMDMSHCLRLCFAYKNIDEIRLGVQRLAYAIRDTLP